MDLKQLRDNQGLTMKEIAQMLGVSENYLWMIESGKRKMSKLLAEKFDNIVNNIASDDNIVIKNPTQPPQNQPSVASPPPLEALAQNADLAVVPAEHLEVVQANNELLEEIREDQKRELEIKRKQSSMLGEMVEAIQGLDTVVQARVRDIIDERTRTIIAMSNHHVHTQSQIMITALEGIINMLDAGINNTDIFRKQLETVRQQLKEMATYKQ